ncbi:MAG TPA: AmmeMemoRadiSam system protein B [Rugosimonospora sp.]|nr:AmmeMemoRadiSam system protein B [Rugosimonospora sp.]
MSVRAPAVAGRFYPGDPVTLLSTVDDLLAGAGVTGSVDGVARAYVVPHAGLRYSGAVAARVYARLRGQPVRTVVLVGPAHFVPLRGCAVPTTDAWATPLGDVPIAVDAARALVAGRHAGADDAPHASEHSLEVQLPLLHRVLPEAAVLPVAVGQVPAPDVAALLDAALAAGGPGTVLVCSTDLSHYLTQDEALATDRVTIDAICERAPGRVGLRAACGVFALRGLLAWATGADAQPALLEHRTSYDTTGDASRVVGYAAFALP